MKLHRFINEHLEQILAEWVAFAKTIEPEAGQMSIVELRDHAKGILQAISLDIETRQNSRQQDQKSKGLAPEAGAQQSAASIHGALRHASDFSLVQLSAEFRALRATVLRLWLPQVREMSESAAYEMVRFNEAIDQALAESVLTYSARADHMRELFLAILGHDLRVPLFTLGLAGEAIKPPLTDEEIQASGQRIRRSTRLMKSMVADLLGYASTQLRGGMPIKCKQTNLGEVCAAALEDASATHPDSRFELKTEGDLTGDFDADRLHQLLANLLVNAGQYGAKDRAVVMVAHGEAPAVIVSVTNYGPPIPASSLEAIFKPLVQLPEADEDSTRPRTSLGLGLFIAREIAMAHGGDLDAASDDSIGTTTFTVRLPRSASVTSG
jgi:signal transduction histidine kinase